MTISAVRFPEVPTSLTVGSGRQTALYALLLTQARHKNYIDETRDSLITTAVAYFDRDDDKPRLMKSLFYQAIINSNAKDFPPAMTSAMRAFKLAENLNDTYWQARISELIGHIFSETYFHEEAAEYLKLAAKLYIKDNREKSYYFALCDLAVSYSNSLNYKTYDPLKVTVEGLKVETPGEFVKIADIPAEGISFDFTVVFNKDIEPIYEIIVNNKSEYTCEDGMNPEVTDKSWELRLLSGKPDYKYHVVIMPNDTGEERIVQFMLGKGKDYAQIRLTQAK